MSDPAPGNGLAGALLVTDPASATGGAAPSPGWDRTAGAAARVGLGRPELWPLALLAYLVRGGLALHLVPVVVVPSTVGLATFIGPTALTPAGPSEAFAQFLAALLVGLTAWLVGGGLVAAAAELALLGRVPPSAGRRVSAGSAARALIVRLAALLPLLAVLAWGLPRIIGAAYRELTLPSDTAAPVALRVLRDVPEVVVLVLLAWLAGETVGGIAVRRFALLGEGGGAALRGALRHVATRPATTLATSAVAACGSVVLVGPGLAAAALALQRLGRALAAGSDPVAIVLLTALFVAAWLLGLVLAGAASSWRGLAWTFEVRRTH